MASLPHTINAEAMLAELGPLPKTWAADAPDAATLGS